MISNSYRNPAELSQHIQRLFTKGYWMASKAVWTTKDGRKVRVRDMTDTHLTNTIKFLMRHAQRLCSKDTLMFLVGPRPQGDMACMAFDEAADEMFERTWEDYVPDIFWDMHEEYTRRGFDLDALTDYDKAITSSAAALEIGALCKHLELKGKSGKTTG